MVVRGHLRHAESGCFEHAMFVMVVQVGQEAEVAREAVSIIRGHEATDKVK